MSSDMHLFISLLAALQVLLIQEYDCTANVAVFTPAQQKSTWYDADKQYFSSAWRAVDGKGRVPGEPEEGCASTADGTDTDAWWMVNLQRLYVIVNITVSGKVDNFERLRDFYIRVGNSSDISQHTYCTYKSGWVQLRVRETFECNRTLVGSWVSIQRTNDKGSTDDGGQGWLQLCEVQVFGYEKRPCGYRKFGLACRNICHCANNWDCHKETGVCPEEACDEGYGGSTCSIELPTLYWRNENIARPVDNTNHVRIVFYQFKKGPYVYHGSGDGPVGEYTVDVKEEGSTDWAAMAMIAHDDTMDRLNVTVTGLKYYHQYTMRIVPWYQRGDVKLRGRADTFTVRTDCGRPEKPVITEITAERVTGGANMIVRFKVFKDGHNCIRYKKADISRRLLDTPFAPWTDYDWFYLKERRVHVFINATHMTKKNEIKVTIYNNEDKWTKSDITRFTPVTVSTPWSPTATFTVRSNTRHRPDVTDVYTESQTPNKVSPGPSVNNRSGVNAGNITGGVISAVSLIIITALLIYIWRLKRGSRTNPAKAKETNHVKNNQVLDHSKTEPGNQDENNKAEVPGMDGVYESVGLSAIGRHSYVNVDRNKYETLDKQQITTPEPKTYAKLDLRECTHDEP